MAILVISVIYFVFHVDRIFCRVSQVHKIIAWTVCVFNLLQWISSTGQRFHLSLCVEIWILSWALFSISNVGGDLRSHSRFYKRNMQKLSIDFIVYSSTLWQERRWAIYNSVEERRVFWEGKIPLLDRKAEIFSDGGADDFIDLKNCKTYRVDYRAYQYLVHRMRDPFRQREIVCSISMPWWNV